MAFWVKILEEYLGVHTKVYTIEVEGKEVNRDKFDMCRQDN